MTDQIDLAAIRARVAAATPGPWRSARNVKHAVMVGPEDAPRHICASGPLSIGTADDTALIAHAPADIAALCDEVERLRSELDDARNIALGLTDDCAGLREIIAGRTTPPTDAEIEVHHAAGGSWMYRGIGRYPIVRALCRQDAVLIAEMIRTDIGGVADGSCWWALSAQYAPCAWPVVSEKGDDE